MSMLVASAGPLLGSPISDTPVRLPTSDSARAKSGIGYTLTVIPPERASEGAGPPRVLGCFSRPSVVCVDGNTGETLHEMKPHHHGYAYTLTAYEERIACGMSNGKSISIDGPIVYI
jgi:hypothetical protein